MKSLECLAKWFVFFGAGSEKPFHLLLRRDFHLSVVLSKKFNNSVDCDQSMGRLGNKDIIMRFSQT